MIQGNGTLPESQHPLTRELIATTHPGQRILLVGVGSGRHLAALHAAGLTVEAVEAGAPLPARFDFDGALSTHALLHGRPETIAATLAAVAARLRDGATFAFTLGSTRDPRFGQGVRLDDSTWAPEAGDEAGVAHAYFDERGVRALLDGWEIVALTEGDASATAGAWAHPSGTASLVHWFVRARRRAQ